MCSESLFRPVPIALQSDFVNPSMKTEHVFPSMFESGCRGQDGPPRHEDYFELKTTETLWAQEKLLSLLYTEECNWGPFPE